MAQAGSQEGGERVWWWKAAMHLDEAQLAVANAMAHNLDDPGPIPALQDKLREGQAILLEIFRAKGLLPKSTNGKAEIPLPPPAPGDVATVMKAMEVAAAFQVIEAAVAGQMAEIAVAVEAVTTAPPPEVAAASEVAVPEVEAPPLAPTPDSEAPR